MENEENVIEQAENGVEDLRRVRVATELMIRGNVLSMLGQMLSEAKDPRSLYVISEHIQEMLKNDRPLYFTAILAPAVEELRQAGLRGISKEYEITD